MIEVPSPNHEPREHAAHFVVIHATVGSLRSALSWLTNPASKVSAHYLIAKNGEVFKLVDEQRVAWHAGKSQWMGHSGLNAYSIGIELVNRNDGSDPYPDEQYQACAELVASICHRLHIPVDREHVIGHYEISPGRKTDPAGFDLDKLVKMASAVLNG